MRPVLFGVSAAALLAGLAHAASVTGSWRGEAEGAEMQLDLTENLDGSITGRFRGVRSGIDLPVQGAWRQGDEIVVELQGISFRYQFKADEDELWGTVTREDRSFDLDMDRAEPLAGPRPQEPAGPPQYAVATVNFPSEDPGVTLSGTLTMPLGEGPFPAVVLITPDGAQDRDAAQFGHHPQAVIADALTQAGIAVLRFDDRGVGGSSGLFDSTDTNGYARDAAGAFAFLAARKDIDPKRIAMMGRNNGAAIAAKAGLAKGAAAYVLWSAPGEAGRASAERQMAQGMREGGTDEETIAERIALQNRVFDIIVANPGMSQADLNAQLIALIREEAGMLSMFVSDATLLSMIRRTTTPWFKHYIGYDPREDFAKIAAPVLLVYGEKDAANPPDRAGEAVKTAMAGNGAVQLTVVPGVNAALASPMADPDATAWSREETVAPAALSQLTLWLSATLKAGS